MTNKTQPRDWNKAIDAIIKAMEHRYVSEFRSVAFPILQEFDAQNQAVCHNCIPDVQGITPVEMERYNYMGAMADIDELIRVIASSYENKTMGKLVDYLESNYKKQWFKYMNEETAPTELPIEPGFLHSDGSYQKFYDINSGHGNAPTEAPFEWVIGEAYEDRQRLIYVYVGKNPVKTDKNPLLFVNRESSQPVARFNDGTSELSSEYDIIRKHTPAPAEHTVEFWVNVYKISKGKIVTEYYEDVSEAHSNNVEQRIACLPFVRTFKEGEGL